MTVKALIEKLANYNQTAEVKVVAHNTMSDFVTAFGTSKGCEKDTCDTVFLNSHLFQGEAEERIQENASNGFLACCYDPEDYYEETNYVDKDGELQCNSSGCEVFATEDEAIEYADDNKPYDWISFAMPAGCGSSLKEWEFGRTIETNSKKLLFEFIAENFC